jgi:co-chaperonin GroES (HSP10)/phage replication-related protein YjqB (UPF0714/DUF867 family)
MASYEASVKKALSSQRDLKRRKEHCSADPKKLATVGRALGHQVRIKRNTTEYGLYTASQARQERPDNIARMGETGRKRLGTSDAFVATLDSQVAHPTYNDDDAKTKNEFVERLKDNGTHTGLVVIAPHGGDIEPHTDQQAERVASRLMAKEVSSWLCKGWWNGQGDAVDHWHITSTDIHEASFPRLNSIISRRFTYAVAFHGFHKPEILIGGGSAAESLKQEIKTEIERAIAGSGICVRIASPNEQYGGDSTQNIVNRLTADRESGIQIEQSRQARSSHWQCIADAVADVYDRKLTFMKFRPLHGRVLIKRIDAEEKTSGGIIIPDTAKEKPPLGEIIAVGPGGRDENGKLIPNDLEVGDTVLFGKWSGTEVKIDGQDLLIMKESDIMGVIERGAARQEEGRVSAR